MSQESKITPTELLSRRQRREGATGARKKGPAADDTSVGPDEASRLLLLPLPMPHFSPSAHRHRRRRECRADVVGCVEGWKWPRSLQSASVSAVPMQRRAGKPPIMASTCTPAGSQITMASANTLGLDAVSSSFPLLPSSFSLLVPMFPGGLLRLVRSNESTARPSLSITPSAPPGFNPPVGFRFQGWDEKDSNVKPT